MASRKRRIAVLAVIVGMALFTAVYGLAFPSGALAWDDCPKGLVNDPYPGACRRYIDTNGDGICDLSQSKPADTTTTTAPAVTTTTVGDPPTGDCPLGPCTNCGACLGVGTTATSTDNSSDASSTGSAEAGGGAAVLAAGDSATTTSTTAPSSDSTATSSDNLAAADAISATAVVSESGGFLTHYLVSPIALGFVLIYGTSFFLYKSRRMRVATHRKIWNVLLLGTFLVTGVFGVILTIQLDYALPFTIPVDLLFWHVEAGMAMTFISLFHMGWHFTYYKNLVRVTRAKTRAIRAAERDLEIADRRVVVEARQARRAERDARRTERDIRRAKRETRRIERETRPATEPREAPAN